MVEKEYSRVVDHAVNTAWTILSLSRDKSLVLRLLHSMCIVDRLRRMTIVCCSRWISPIRFTIRCTANRAATTSYHRMQPPKQLRAVSCWRRQRRRKDASNSASTITIRRHRRRGGITTDRGRTHRRNNNARVSRRARAWVSRVARRTLETLRHL